MRTIETPLDNILSLIACASDYGFEGDVLFTAFRDMLDSKLSDEEIEAYARSVEALDGYTEEDYEEIKERLEEFKDKYCVKERKTIDDFHNELNSWYMHKPDCFCSDCGN